MKDLDPNYTAKCSLQTVCDPDNGFFVEFLDTAKDSCGSSWIKNDFANLQTNEEKLKSVFDIGEVLGTLEHVSPVFKEKNQRIAVQRRLEGDMAAKGGDFKKALLLYSQSVIRSPHEIPDPSIDDGITLAKALWSRSAVLVELKKGELALQDLKYSQEMGVSVTNNPDFYWRMGQCYTRNICVIYYFNSLINIKCHFSYGREKESRDRLQRDGKNDSGASDSFGEIKDRSG